MWLPPQSVRLAGGQPLQRGMLKQDSFVFSLALAPSINTVGTWLSVCLSFLSGVFYPLTSRKQFQQSLQICTFMGENTLLMPQDEGK